MPSVIPLSCENDSDKFCTKRLPSRRPHFNPRKTNRRESRTLRISERNAPSSSRRPTSLSTLSRRASLAGSHFRERPSTTRMACSTRRNSPAALQQAAGLLRRQQFPLAQRLQPLRHLLSRAGKPPRASSIPRMKSRSYSPPGPVLKLSTPPESAIRWRIARSSGMNSRARGKAFFQPGQPLRRR